MTTQVNRPPRCRMCCRLSLRPTGTMEDQKLLFANQSSNLLAQPAQPPLQITCAVVGLPNAVFDATRVLGITATWTCNGGFANSNGANQGRYTSESCGADGSLSAGGGGCTQVRLELACDQRLGLPPKARV